MDLPGRVLAAVRARRLVPVDGRVLVSLSGGSDSVGLLHLLRAIEGAGRFVVAGAAHLNHGLREAAVADEAFCRELVQRLGLPFVTETVDVASLARTWRTSREDAGRRARYAFFERAARDLGADVIATGHTRDDQAETFLLQLMRGAGPRGLSSIRSRAGRVCRPLLDIGRAEIRTWLAENGHNFREDESNTDAAYTRNRVRHDLIPYLQRSFSPGIVQVLAREAAIAHQDEDRLHAEAIEAAASVVLVRSGDRRGLAPVPVPDALDDVEEVELDAVALRSLHPAVGSRVGRIALAILAPERFVGFDHVERLLHLARNADEPAVSLPGQHARRFGNTILLRRAPAVAFENSFHVPLSIPGEVVLSSQGWAVSASWAGAGHSEAAVPTRGGPGGSSELSVPVDTERLALPLAVRSRRRGDRFKPAGLGGRAKKLQDLFVDRKIVREMRDSLPLVVDGADRIVWVVGEAVSEDFRVTAPSQGVLLLKARRLGGPG
jgi:tRNA(Ile)-lysidine synthase